MIWFGGIVNTINHPHRSHRSSVGTHPATLWRRCVTMKTLERQLRHSNAERWNGTPVRAYYQYGESPYQSKPKAL